jgi:hypothetical protein
MPARLLQPLRKDYPQISEENAENMLDVCTNTHLSVLFKYNSQYFVTSFDATCYVRLLNILEKRIFRNSFGIFAGCYVFVQQFFVLA